MIYSLLADENMYFMSMHAECALHTYSSEFLHSDIISDARKVKGIYCKKVNADILKNIYEYKFEEKDICIDFSKIEEISDNNILGFINYIKKKFCSQNKLVYFLNLNKKIYDNMEIADVFNIMVQSDEVLSGSIGKTKNVIKYEDLIEKNRILLDNKIEKMITDATEECKDEHTSVPVYLSKYINLKKMVESNSRLIRLSIYYLALKMIDNGIVSKNPLDNNNLSLFFHTINGGYIATQLAELLYVDLVYLDHLGPIESVHRKHFEKSIRDNRNYIIVSDVICLGGEIGRARTIVEYCGGKVLGEICLVDIKTIQSERLKSRISLYTVSNECNKIGYTIRTDLCKMCDMRRKEDSK